MAARRLKIRAGDHVKVITGKDRGHVGRVLRVVPEDRKVVVEGAGRVRRHHKPANGQPGGIVEKEMPIDVSNVALWNATDGRVVKVAYRIETDGTKVRVDRKTGAAIDG